MKRTNLTILLLLLTNSYASFALPLTRSPLPPIIESVQDGGYANGNNCFLVVSFRSQGTDEVEYDIERKAAGSSIWEKIVTVAKGQTQARIEIIGEKRGWIRMISVTGDGEMSDYTPNEQSFCQED